MKLNMALFLSKNRPTEKCIFLPITTANSVELNIKEKQYECFYRNVSISVDKKSGVEDMKRQIIHEKCHIINVPNNLETMEKDKNEMRCSCRQEQTIAVSPPIEKQLDMFASKISVVYNEIYNKDK